MAEAVAIVIGGGVIGLAVLALAVGLGLSLSLWETWWLYPLWSVVMMPLGLPAITFWQLFAINIFISTFFMAVPHGDYAKEPDSTKQTTAQLLRLLACYSRPVIAYYLIRWAL